MENEQITTLMSKLKCEPSDIVEAVLKLVNEINAAMAFGHDMIKGCPITGENDFNISIDGLRAIRSLLIGMSNDLRFTSTQHRLVALLIDNMVRVMKKTKNEEFVNEVMK